MTRPLAAGLLLASALSLAAAAAAAGGQSLSAGARASGGSSEIGVAGGPASAIESGLDYHSYANVDQFRVTHVDMDLTVDFDSHQLRGSVILEIRRLDAHASQLVLDSKELNVGDVSQLSADIVGGTGKQQPMWVSRPFHNGKPDPILGSPLVIDLPPSRAQSETVKIDYETSPAAAALQWLAPAQTARKRKPFLYTQNEPIGARSWIPLQDTPQVRATYRANIHTPSDLLAVMSAVNDPKAKRNGEYWFVMPEAIPSYLIALAVGDLVFKATGPRTGVYAERPVAAAAAKEFADTETMIEACEKLFGPYRWGRYDVLLLPPSFPLGGMENPRISFITPTVIVGDKSLVSLIAHELSHSWSGNLVTNATWRDLWLNEGFTVYLQSRIMQAVYGERREAMEDVLGLRSLRDDLATLAPQDQLLAIDLRGRDPDDVFSEVPYEKGRLFLRYLEAEFGRARFDEFLHGYFDHFAFQSITTEQFLAYLQDHLIDRFPGIVSRKQVAAWIVEPGIPPDAVLPTSAALDAVDAARGAWLQGGVAAVKLDTQGWVTQQWLHFLNNMPAALTRAQLAELDQAFAFNKSRNAEIAHSWLKIAIRNDYQPAFARLEEYLVSIGRRKLIKPLYEELVKTPAGAQFAKRVYAKARPGYHALTAATIDAIVTPPAGTTTP
jgi:leukotriene-A4 hydrolase